MMRVAVIGLGNIAKRHRSNIKKMFPEAEIIAMSASGRLPSEMICNADYIVSNIQNIIDYTVEMAVIASPAPFHSLHAIPLIEAGIPVLIEKPVTTSVEDAKSIIKAKSKYQVNAGVGYCLKYLSSALFVKKIIESGQAGKVINANIEIGQYLPDWRPNTDYKKSVSAVHSLGGGVLFELSHDIDYAQWLFGKLEIKHALIRNTGELGIEVEDVADILAISQSGCVVSLHLDFLQRQASRKCKIISNRGALVWDLIKNQVVWTDETGESVLFSDELWDRNEMYLNMLSDFNNKNKSDSFSSIESSLSVVELITDLKTKFGIES
ncbi:Gfo/Idh/MocA family protein [Pseudoalteromonas sp. 1_2015MBL_MicDiv]|uniref:Gfo/Idh/MocA family protein n=1 Tax=Pseudoalteromonas sp. 1_2015MBL_MicDiv TaxID=1720343 RepID=UPI000BBEE6E1|nr:Gfo/Idh/MocA family oxidoreductase [Pseudoalteromonas sp. 1_2015MBL_MicDiv]ATG76497.1 oxidoreductase [Pseudoalteromonas sp. 1_2015MBL_MicDiv]